MDDAKQKRIENYQRNLLAAKKLNPMSVIFIEAALETLQEDDLIGLRDKIDSVRVKVSMMITKRDKKGEVRARARWGELNWIKRNLYR